MNRSQRIINLVNETLTSALPAITDLRGGEEVMFKPGTEYEGMVGLIMSAHTDRGVVDLKVGGATKTDIPVADLLLLSNTSNMAQDKAAPPVSDTVAAPEVPAAGV